ncbi:MAG: HD domain-containing protein [Desulfobacteraceae bacterium]|nr:MAG: HD domain-containing protein [Desulfobacteraceae bacterium]
MAHTSSPSDYDITARILRRIDELNHLNDIDTILDKILYEARRLSHADAGSIFIRENENLRFGYVHNDTLFSGKGAGEALYADFSIPINDHSIVGYAALTGETVVIDNAYRISSERPFSFNPEYDRKSGYITRSMLTIPLMTFHGRLVGVMQLINALNAEGRVTTFSEEARRMVPLFANNAAVAVDRGIMNREMILRMVRMAELRDPSETGAHVQRVGAYSAEIYQLWAEKNGIDSQQIKREKDLIRLAAMLHDVGKVGIPDQILKKPAQLTDAEYDMMKQHTIFGGRLFAGRTSHLDEMSMDIALGHHEKWSGGGYPGRIDDLMAPEIHMRAPKKSDEIPLSARIVALADVYDAMRSARCYKQAWDDDRVLETIQNEAGRHFDPELVAVFFELLPVIKAIGNRFPG